MKRTLIVTAALGALLWAAAASSAPAQPTAQPPTAGPRMHEGMGPHGPGGGPMRGMVGRGGLGHGLTGLGAWRQLDLTEAQRDKIADIRDRAMRKNVQTRADLEIARLDLAKLMRAERPDARAIDAQIDRLAMLRASIQKSHVAALLEARSVLTPEQLKQLHDLRDREPRGGGARMGSGFEGDLPDPPEDDGIEG